MPTGTLYRHGVCVGTAPRVVRLPKSKRGRVGGWSSKACQRNTAFLRSVETDHLGPLGLACTFTLKDCPQSARVWHELRGALLKRLYRIGLVRLHWVVEWQRRGVPHLHCAAYFRDRWAAEGVSVPEAVREAWVDVASEYGAARWSQTVEQITDALGWLQYVAKHASRGIRHYQRSPENIPKGWQGETGRVWGKVGAWPIVEPVKYQVQQGAYFRLRRMIRAWRIADARCDRDLRKRGLRVRLARAMLKCKERKLSTVRGCSEWCPVSGRMLEYLGAQGYQIVNRSTGELLGW